MSFIKINPRSTSVRNRKAAVEVTIGRCMGRSLDGTLEMRLTIRCNQLQLAPYLSFLKPGAKVSVAVGQDDHRGWLSIERDGPHRCYRPGGSDSENVLMIGFPVPECALSRPARFEADEVRADDGQLLVRIPGGILKAVAPAGAPATARTPGVLPAQAEPPAVAPAAPKGATAGFRSAIADVPHNVRRGA